MSERPEETSIKIGKKNSQSENNKIVREFFLKKSKCNQKNTTCSFLICIIHCHVVSHQEDRNKITTIPSAWINSGKPSENDC